MNEKRAQRITVAAALLVEALSKQHSTQTLAHWSQAEAKPKVRAALERIGATR